MDNFQILKSITVKALGRAKEWYRAYLIAQVAVLGFAILSIFAELNPNLSALIAFTCVLLTEMLRWRSDYWKTEGESAKRRWELASGFGVPVDNQYIADWLAARPRGFIDRVMAPQIEGLNFESTHPPGCVRTIENTQESAWWSKHESRRLTAYLSCLLLAVLVSAFTALTISIARLQAQHVAQSGASLQNVGGVICAVLMFVISVNLLRLIVEFSTFSASAERILQRCHDLLHEPAPTEREVLSLLHDYQTARHSAPLLPTLIWKLHRKHLSEQWSIFRPRQPLPAPQPTGHP
jgi:hypothetical protein